MSSQRCIEMQVDQHSSGNLTLKERNVGDRMWTDVKGKPLFVNLDAVSFYRAVARRLANYSRRGITVERYNDTAKF